MRYPILHAVSRAEKLGSRSRLRTIGCVEYSWFVRLILERRRFVGVISPDYRHWLLIDEDRLANSIYSVLVIDRMVFRKAAINQIWHQQSISLSLCRVMPQHCTPPQNPVQIKTPEDLQLRTVRHVVWTIEYPYARRKRTLTFQNPECWIRCRLGIAWLVCQDTRISWPGLVVGTNMLGVDGWQEAIWIQEKKWNWRVQSSECR